MRRLGTGLSSFGNAGEVGMEREDGGSKRLPNGILFLISSLYNVYRTKLCGLEAEMPLTIRLVI